MRGRVRVRDQEKEKTWCMERQSPVLFLLPCLLPVACLLFLLPLPLCCAPRRAAKRTGQRANVSSAQRRRAARAREGAPPRKWRRVVSPKHPRNATSRMCRKPAAKPDRQTVRRRRLRRAAAAPARTPRAGGRVMEEAYACRRRGKYRCAGGGNAGERHAATRQRAGRG